MVERNADKQRLERATGRYGRGRRAAKSAKAAIIEIPDLLQSIGQAGRTGQLRVGTSGAHLAVQFKNGAVVGCDNDRAGALARALVWTGQIEPGSWVRHGIPEPTSLSDQELGELLIELGVIQRDGIRDAVDCHVEECLTDLLGWQNTDCSFEAEAELSPWLDYQYRLGTAIPPSSLLMEGLRRQDELRRVSRHIPATWDVLMRSSVQAGVTSTAEARILESWREGRPVGAIFELSGLPPWDNHYAVANLIDRKVFRPASGDELIVFADRARAETHHRTAEGLYRRALELGSRSPRIYLALSELAERRGDTAAAARDCLLGADAGEVASPGDAVLALRSALRLGAERERCLKKLARIYQRLDARDEALDTLFELAQHYEGVDRIADAMEVVREAQRLGAEPVQCAQVLAALALLIDDQEEAVVQLEQVVRGAQHKLDKAAAQQARGQLLMIEPGRCKVALEFARGLVEDGKRDAAITVLEKALQSDNRLGSEELEISMRELIVELKPGDTRHRTWLAKIYQNRKDRSGALTQLQHLADAQEQAGNLIGAIETLQRLLDLGGDTASTHRRLARLQQDLGHDAASRDAWLAAIRLCRQGGEADRAEEWAVEALTGHPCDFALQELRADLAGSRGDHELAARHYSDAIRLATCLQDEAHLRHAIDRFRSLQPDSLWVRLEAFQWATHHDFPDRDQFFADFSRWCLEQDNLGLALHCAETRVALALPPALAARQDYVPLLVETGHGQQALDEGTRLLGELLDAHLAEEAAELLGLLEGAYPDHPDFALHCAGFSIRLDDPDGAVRYVRKAIALLQRDGRTRDALRACDQLNTLTPDDPELLRARDLVASGEAVNWQQIRQQIEDASKQRLEEAIAEAPDDGRGSSQWERRAKTTV